MTGQVITQFQPAGTLCQPEDLCITGGVCNGQGACVGTPSDAAGCTKPRYISLVPGGAGIPTAVRVTLDSLHHPEPPYSPGVLMRDFSAIEGEQRWVGPVMECPDSPSIGEMMKCAKLQCEPAYVDWAAELSGAALHITGAEIVPSSRYEIDLLAPECAGVEDTCELVLPWQTLSTARWGDVVVPFQDPAKGLSQPTAIDVAAVVDKVRDLPLACCKARIQLSQPDMNPMAPAAAVDVASVVDAVRGLGYPHACPTSCSP
jgi:hypothetical protein